MCYWACKAVAKVNTLHMIFSTVNILECPALKVDLFLSYRHQLIPDDDLGPLYDLLIDQPQEIRRAIGELVYDHLIAQKFNSSPSTLTGFLLYQPNSEH